MRPIRFGRKPLPQWLAYLIVFLGPLLVPVLGAVALVAIELFAVFLWIAALVLSPLLWIGYQIDRFLFRRLLDRSMSGTILTLVHFLIGAGTMIGATVMAYHSPAPFWTFPAGVVLSLAILHNIQLVRHYDTA